MMFRTTRQGMTSIPAGTQPRAAVLLPGIANLPIGAVAATLKMSPKASWQNVAQPPSAVWCAVSIILALLAGILPGCSMSNPSKRPLTTAVNNYLVPDSTQGKILASPVLLVTGGTAIIADALIVHPVMEMDDAMRDTYIVCWSGFGEEGRYVSDCASIPVRLIGTPLVYLLDWVARGIEDAPAHPAEKNEPDEEGNPKQEGVAAFPFNLHEDK